MFLHSTFCILHFFHKRFCISLLTGFLWMLAAPVAWLATPLAWLTLSGTAEADNGIQYYLNCSTNDGLTQEETDTWDTFIWDNGFWHPQVGGWVWTPGHRTNAVDGLGDGIRYTIYFKRVRDFYVPTNQFKTVTGSITNGYTNSYHIYSNTLSVVVTGITSGASAAWRLTPGSDNEYTNSSTYSTYGTVFTNTAPDYSKTLSIIPTGTYNLAFNSVRGYQSPPANSVAITGQPAGWFSTNTYIPYSNSLVVTIAGITTTTNVIWNLSGPGEFTNSVNYGTSFTNTWPVTLIPTGNYTVTFPAVVGYTNPVPNPASTNITFASDLTNNVTGTYTRVLGTIGITVNPTTGSWSFTTSPTDFTNYTASALSGTNSATLTNAAIGAYTIHYYPISGYGTPADETKTNTLASTNLQFSGDYLLGYSNLKVRFLPVAVQGNARWWIYDNTDFSTYGPFTNNHTYSLKSSNDYTVSYTAVEDYYLSAATNLDNFIGDRILTNTYLPYTNALYIETVDERGNPIDADWTIRSYPAEFTNSSAFDTNGFLDMVYSPVPTGTYEVVYHDKTGYKSAPAIQTNTIVGETNVYFTGVYTRAVGTITVTVSPTNGSWTFTAYPTNVISFTNYCTNALSGTNGGTLTNAPVGVYTIHFNSIGSPYTAPSDQTKINTAASTNLDFVGTYLTDSNSVLTVDFMPLVVQPSAHWKVGVATPSWKNHHESVSLLNGYDYLIQYSAVKDYWLAPNYTLSNMFGNVTITNTFLPYTNSLSVVITGITDNSSATWQIAPFTEFTNSSAYSATYTDSRSLSPIPTGSYAITFNDVYGYIKPAGITTNITGNLTAPTVTGAYTRTLATIEVDVWPSNGIWQFSSYPADFANYSASALSGIGDATLTNTPMGEYTIEFVDKVNGYDPPVPATQTKTNNPYVTTIFKGVYTLGRRLTVHVVTAADTNLLGLGFGTNTIAPTTNSYFDGVENWYFQSSITPDITILAIPSTNEVLKNFFYKFAGDIGEESPGNNPIVVKMDQNRTIRLYFSREYQPYDNYGDLDGDGLPDVWELANFILGFKAAESANSPYGRNNNTDSDFIPSSGTNPVMQVWIDANGVAYYSGSGDIGYPLLRDQLLRHQALELPLSGAQLGYSKGKPFDNFLECRGLDGYYKTNVPPGGPVYTSEYGDDPRTNPEKFDTFSADATTGISDGWKYYFWYWRSADAYNTGVTNSANLSWVSISSRVEFDEGHDTDGDGFADGEEYSDYWTDPTHCDTDADGMDDKWEIVNIIPSANSNALDNANGLGNPDNDYMAWVNQGMLTYGMIGTALGTNVCWSGGTAANPNAAWNEIYTATGANVFDLYRDTILKASAALTNHAAGARYAFTNYFGTSAGLTYKNGYPVWVDMDTNGVYSAGDIALVNPSIKHDGVYSMAPATPYPGVCSFNPYTAWTNIALVENGIPEAAPNTIPYTIYQEYLGGDYIGRLSWDAGGQRSSLNDVEGALTRNGYSNPQNQDSEGDFMPDGWELYVGLNPNLNDAGVDPDSDELSNLGEWANATHLLGTCALTWPNKLLPTDPGVITAPQPNDPHPRDTDWDGVTDNAEQAPGSNPTAWDTDNDHLPDGWEIYAGTSITNSDAQADLDGDGLLNWQEYWCGTVPEWQLCNPDWQTIYFCVRLAMTWDPFKDPSWGRANTLFIPPDYISDPCFMYVNSVYTDLGYLRTNYPAASAWSAPSDPITVPYYHTPFAGVTNNAFDSDGDNMDDYWEVYHGLNPCRGSECMVIDYVPRYVNLFGNVEEPDADPTTPGYQFGTEGNPFDSLPEYIQYVEPYRNDPDDRLIRMLNIVGPFNLGLNGMDPDGDNLPNLEEYSFSSNRVFYHTDPTPIWRTDQNDTNSFIVNNYTFDAAPPEFFEDWGCDSANVYPFEFEIVEGYDTDNDGMSDYTEINSAAGQTGNNPLDDRNPIRNRALYFNGTNDFARQVRNRMSPESTLARFCVEAWIKPNDPLHNPLLDPEQVVLERGGLYRNPLNLSQTNVGANFRMGITNGLPYVLYNGRGSLRTYQATAQTKHRIQSNTTWTHIAGNYDGTNLTIYVNGEESYSLRTTELPANGFDILLPDNTALFTPHTLMVGAQDNKAGRSMFSYYPVPTNYFGGCVDEVRVWDGARTRAEILANKDRRLTQNDITNAMSSIYNYFTFDDVPDPDRTGEAIVPSGMADISFDMHPTIAWWRNYAMRSTVYTGVTNSYNYIVYANDQAWHSRATSPAYDDNYHFSTNYNTGTNALSGYVNPGNPYHDIVWNFNRVYDLLLFRSTRSVATNSWLSGLSSDPDSTDSDGDGLPDWWEQLYNLDPNDATGNNGAWGDVDNDGLNNRAEYLAGTNPRNSDTDGDGIGDYDSRSGDYTRTWGEMYMDGDGMPDTWEIQYGLDPYHYDANLDLDNDGWSNYAEYQGGTNPNDATSYPQPTVSGSADYFGNKSGTFRFYVYATNTMDGEPLVTQVGAGQQVAETIGKADGTLYFSGRLPIYPIDQTTVVRISAPAGTNSSTVTFTFTSPTAYTYSGAGTDYDVRLNYTTGRINIRWASTEVPAASANVSVDYTYANRNSAAFSLTGFREGDFYLLALLDNGNNTFDSGEPLGLMEGQPLTLGYTSLPGMRIHVKDNAPGYGRFAWTANTTGTSDYPVVINKISEQNAPAILTRNMRWSRNFFHEWDYQMAGLYGLSAGNYQWWMNSQQGTFSVSWPASVSTPSLIYPRGDQLNYAVNQFKWTMDSYSTMYHLQVARQASDRGLAFVIDQYYRTPYCDQSGISQADLPLFAGELGDGVYYWRVASWSPAGESAWSEAQTFEINLSATNSHWIAGDIYYFGKADCSNIIVEAFDNRGFSGKPEARVLLTGAGRADSFKGSFTLRGLPEGTYYVRAYLDVTPAGGTRSGKLDKPWESFGFIRDPNNDYQPRIIQLFNTMFVDGTKLVIRDQDTDNDLLPDAWEMYYFGNLDQTGDMDYDGDGETNLEEYMRDGVDMNPAFWDTDGDGLSDNFEINYTAPSFGYSAKSGLQLNPILWDTDGDGYSDGAELKRYHTNPLDPTSYPRYQPMCFDSSRSPGDYDGDGRSDLNIYDVANGNWYLMTAYGGFFNLPFGSSATQPMLGDYDGDGCDDFAVFEPATGAWHLYNAWTGQSFRLNFGDSEMIPVPADYDGDNKTDLAVYYPAEGMWYIYSAWSGQFYSLKFGGPTCVPVPGDYNNDGAGDLATYEPNSGNWNIFTFDHYRHEGTYFSGNFGDPTKTPAPGDYDGDGRNDAALFEASTGNWYILTWRGQFLSGQFGCYGCIPAPGDYDGDGRTDICVYYPPTGTWYIYCWSGQAYQVQFGWAAAVPALKGR